ncbi:MAG TPA: family 10 glycosylhydrolase [Acidobacteriota bacterium]
MRKILLSACLLFISPVAFGQEVQLRAFWVDAFHPGIKNRPEVDALVTRARASNINSLVVQVRRRGDAYFLSSLDPFTEDPQVENGFDPLQYLIDRAHANGIQVHAWVIANAIWGPSVSSNPPANPNHSFNLHGPSVQGIENWLTRSSTGLDRFGDYWVDPGHPAVVEYLVQVVRSLAASYQIDGIHFDRIRYPETNPTQGGYDIGYNPVSVQRFNRAFGKTGNPAISDPDWSLWRRLQMTQMFRRLYLEIMDVNPRLKVSAALIAFGAPPAGNNWSTSEAYTRVFQDWQDWLRLGILDIAMPMHYDREHVPVQRNWFDGWIQFDKDRKFARHLVIGQGAFINTIEGTLAQTRRAAETTPAGNGADGIVFYSYATTNTATELTPARDNNDFYAALSSPTSYDVANDPVFKAAAIPPEMPWKPTEAMLLGRVIDALQQPIDGAEVSLHWTSGTESMRTDGNGFFGAARLPAGALDVTVRAGGMLRNFNINVPAGVVKRQAFVLSPPARRRP